MAPSTFRSSALQTQSSKIHRAPATCYELCRVKSAQLEARRSFRSLTERRSGLQLPRAQHPVAGLDLLAPSGELVSCGPSSGELARFSPKEHRKGDAVVLIRHSASPRPEVHQ